MSKTKLFQMPTSSTLTEVAICGGVGIAGAKLSDAIAASLPDSTNGYKKWAIAAVALGAAMCFNPSTTGGKIAQAGFVGMGIKQGSDAISDALVPTIAARTGGKWTDKFVNALVGHDQLVTVPADTAKRSALNAAMYWESSEPVDSMGFGSGEPVEIPMFTGV